MMIVVQLSSDRDVIVLIPVEPTEKKHYISVCSNRMFCYVEHGIASVMQFSDALTTCRRFIRSIFPQQISNSVYWPLSSIRGFTKEFINISG